MITKGYKNAVVLWQEPDEEGIPGEPALLIEGYKDVISITQEDQSIRLNYYSLKELIKALKVVEEEEAGK